MSLITPALTQPPSLPNSSALARRGSDAFATTLSAGISSSDTTIPLTGVTGLSTDTAVTLVIEPGTARQETIIGWVSSLNIINVARHCEGATIDHPINAIVMSYQTAQDHNSLIDFLFLHCNPDGSLKAAAVNAAVTIPQAVPPGSITQYAAAGAPSGWLLAQGQAVSRATYAALFAAIGTTHGVGDGSSTFNLPNLQGNVPVGYKSGDSNFGTLGATGGEKTHTLTTAEMPAHRHSITTTLTGSFPPAGAPDRPIEYGSNSGALPTASYDTNDQGGGGAHNNLQPFVVLQYIIKT